MSAPLTVHLHELDAPGFRVPFLALLDAWRPGGGRGIQLVAAAQGFEVLVAGVPTRALLEAGPQTLIIPWSGVPRSVAALACEFPRLAVHNLHHNAAPVAEHAIGLLLACARRLMPADRGLRAGDWRLRFEPSDAPLIDGRRALILGAGAVGTRIAHACVGLGMTPTLLASRARPASGPFETPTSRTQPAGEALDSPGGPAAASFEVLGPGDLDEALTRADVLFVTLPLTPSTDGLIDARRLALLPRGALLVNVGRGPVVDEAALFEALTSRQLAGAGLDVWYSYPKDAAARAATPPSQFPFGELDHVVLSPHRAGHGAETERLCAEALFAALTRAADGQPIGNPVDPTRGY